MRHSAQAPDDGRDELPVAVVREPADHMLYQQFSDSDAYADAELKLRKERTETMIRRAEEAAS